MFAIYGHTGMGGCGWARYIFYYIARVTSTHAVTHIAHSPRQHPPPSPCHWLCPLLAGILAMLTVVGISCSTCQSCVLYSRSDQTLLSLPSLPCLTRLGPSCRSPTCSCWTCARPRPYCPAGANRIVRSASMYGL